jgi:hypothetical protein
VSKDRTVETMRDDVMKALWSARAAEFVGAGSLIRPGVLSTGTFTCGERLRGQEGGESLSSGRVHHNRI